jgi:hypothetical protein
LVTAVGSLAVAGKANIDVALQAIASHARLEIHRGRIDNMEFSE